MGRGAVFSSNFVFRQNESIHFFYSHRKAFFKLQLGPYITHVYLPFHQVRSACVNGVFFFLYKIQLINQLENYITGELEGL